MTETFASPFAEAFTWMLLHFVWQGAAIAVCYWLLNGHSTFVMARPKLPCARAVSMASPVASRGSASGRYALSLSMLGVMAICPLVTFAWIYDQDSTTRQPTVFLEAIHMAKTIDDAGRRLDTNSSPITSSHLATEKSFTAATHSTPVALGFVGATFNYCQPYLLLLWGVGVFSSGLRLAVGFANILWLRAGVKPIPDALKAQSLLLARKLGLRMVRVFASSRIHEAAVVGFWRPMVLIPAAWLMSLPPEVLQAVIAHELAHIRRLDAWVNLLQRLLETFFFYHPAVWWLSNRVRIEREMCCDELAVKSIGNRGQYAMALESVGRLQSLGTPSLAPSFRGQGRMNGHGKMILYSRIQNVLRANQAPVREPALLLAIALLAITAVLTGVVGSGLLTGSAVAQEGQQRSPVKESTNDEQQVNSQENPQLPTEREKQLMQKLEQLQQELDELRGSMRTVYPASMHEEFELCDKNHDQNISQHEWLSRDSRLIEIEKHDAGKIDHRLDFQLPTPSTPQTRMELVLQQILADEQRRAVHLWKLVDSDSNNGITLAEFARWWNVNRKVFDGTPRKSMSRPAMLQDLEALRFEREVLLARSSPFDPQVHKLSTEIEELELKIKVLGIIDERSGQRPSNGESKLGTGDGEARQKGPREGERKSRTARDGETRKAGTRDGEEVDRAPRNGDTIKRGTREGDAGGVKSPESKSKS